MMAFVITISILMLLVLIVVAFGLFDVHIYPKADKEKIRIACVGDSITYGLGIPLHFLFNFTAILKRKLSNRYQIANYGLNDRTAQYSGHKPYGKEKAFEESLAFKPNIVIFMLGANDTKDINFKSEEQFISEYKELLNHYRNLDTNPKIILCQTCWIDKCPPALKTFNDCQANRITVINECIKKVAEEYRLSLADLYTPTKENKQYFCPDCLHPNLKGHRLIAEKLFEQLIKQEK